MFSAPMPPLMFYPSGGPSSQLDARIADEFESEVLECKERDLVRRVGRECCAVCLCCLFLCLFVRLGCQYAAVRLFMLFRPFF